MQLLEASQKPKQTRLSCSKINCCPGLEKQQHSWGQGSMWYVSAIPAAWLWVQEPRNLLPRQPLTPVAKAMMLLPLLHCQKSFPLSISPSPNNVFHQQNLMESPLITRYEQHNLSAGTQKSTGQLRANRPINRTQGFKNIAEQRPLRLSW